MEIKTKIINGKEKRTVSDKLRQIAKASKGKERKGMATYKELMQVCDYLDDIEVGIDITNLILNYEINKYYKNKYLKVTILIRNTKKS